MREKYLKIKQPCLIFTGNVWRRGKIIKINGVGDDEMLTVRVIDKQKQWTIDIQRFNEGIKPLKQLVHIPSWNKNTDWKKMDKILTKIVQSTKGIGNRHKEYLHDRFKILHADGELLYSLVYDKRDGSNAFLQWCINNKLSNKSKRRQRLFCHKILKKIKHRLSDEPNEVLLYITKMCFICLAFFYIV